jgi:hypothetical protein
MIGYVIFRSSRTPDDFLKRRPSSSEWSLKTSPRRKTSEFPAGSYPFFPGLSPFIFSSASLPNSGFPPTLTPADALGAPTLFFLFLPFFKKIKIGKVLELEREVEKAKKELSDFKGEIRNTVSVLSTNVNTIGRMTNQVTVNLPSLSDLQRARQQVAPPSHQKLKMRFVRLKIILCARANRIERWLWPTHA